MSIKKMWYNFQWKTIGYCTAFKDEQNPYNVIPIYSCIKMKEKQTTTTELEAVALGQAHIYIHTECGWVKHVSGIPTLPLIWDSGMTV